MDTAAPHDFADFNLLPPLLSALERGGYKKPSAIQMQAIPALISGQDVLAIAQTGSGKTAAYALPILDRLGRLAPQRHPGAPTALVLAPTRELATQIASVFRQLGRALPLRTRVACGGLPRDGQIKALAEGVDILVGTPGRLIDLLDGGHLHLENAGLLVLDEADRMLDGDFLEDMARIAAHLPDKRQTALCSATASASVRTLAQRLLHKPVAIEIEAETVTPKRIRQRAIFADKAEKPKLVAAALRGTRDRAIVFVRTKADAERLAGILRREDIAVETIHGDRTQGARNKALDAFRAGRVRALVATDIAARGLDIGDIMLVVNMDLPDKAETYVHRIGRTARAGKRGAALTLCDVDERTTLREIEKKIGYRITIVGPEAL